VIGISVGSDLFEVHRLPLAKRTDTPKKKKGRQKVRDFVPLRFLKFGFDLTEKYRIKTALYTLGVLT
jgi:hypothetical protein